VASVARQSVCVSQIMKSYWHSHFRVTVNSLTDWILVKSQRLPYAADRFRIRISGVPTGYFPAPARAHPIKRLLRWYWKVGGGTMVYAMPKAMHMACACGAEAREFALQATQPAVVPRRLPR
jgi:hypothetical protein